MKVLFDHQIFAIQKFGGINRYYNEIAKPSGYQSQIIDAALVEQHLSKLNSKSFGSRLFRYLKRKLGLSAGTKKNLLPVEVIDQLEGDYDIFHPTYYNPYFLDTVTKPYVLTVYDLIHEIYCEYFGLSDYVLVNKKRLCEKAAHIIAISEQTKNDLIQLFDLPSDKISVTYLASDFDKIIPVMPRTSGVLENYILFIGNRGSYKNFYFFVQAVAVILRDSDSLRLVCTGHAFTQDEQNFFSSIGITSQVVHVYPENDGELAWLYAHARVFVFPSLYEGFGFPLLEAFASSCPVVSSNGGSLPEVGGDAALYFDPKDTQQLRDAVRAALFDESVRAELIAKGKKRFSEFSWERCRQETLAVYEKVVSRKANHAD